MALTAFEITGSNGRVKIRLDINCPASDQTCDVTVLDTNSAVISDANIPLKTLLERARIQKLAEIISTPGLRTSEIYTIATQISFYLSRFR